MFGEKTQMVFRFAKSIKGAIDGKKRIVFACIGSDRSTGDSLGPLVGHMLSSRLRRYEEFEIVGTLKEPLHALNLDKFHQHYTASDCFVVAIDASLGRTDEVGRIVLRSGGLRPGAGVGKDIASVGNISIYGVVNVGSALGMENMVLQCTRLGLVYEMAEEITNIIATGIYISKSNNQAYLDMIETE